MGINTQGVINVAVSAMDVADVIEERLGVLVSIEDTHYDDYKVLCFKYKDESRRMSVFTNYRDVSNYRFTGMDEITLIDLNLWGHSVEIIESVLEAFGGFLIPDDTKDFWRYVDVKEEVMKKLPQLTVAVVTLTDGNVEEFSLRNITELSDKMIKRGLGLNRVCSINFE